jgi:hypothetical protein
MQSLEPRRFASGALAALAVLLSPAPIPAHGAFHARVAALSARIESQPSADHYLERSVLYRGHGQLEAALADLARADALLAAGEPEAALEALDEGLARLGPVVALASRAIEIERARGRADATLERLDRLAAFASRQETWLTRRAEILEEAGRPAEARAAWAAAPRGAIWTTAATRVRPGGTPASTTARGPREGVSSATATATRTASWASAGIRSTSSSPPTSATSSRCPTPAPSRASRCIRCGTTAPSPI